MKALFIALVLLPLSAIAQHAPGSLADLFSKVTAQKVSEGLCGHILWEARETRRNNVELVREQCILVSYDAHHMDPSRQQPDAITTARPSLTYTGIIRAAVRPTPDSKILNCFAQSYVSSYGSALNLEEIKCH